MRANAAFTRLCRASDLLRATDDRPLSIREAAAAAGLSPCHFIRRFRAVSQAIPLAAFEVDEIGRPSHFRLRCGS